MLATVSAAQERFEESMSDADNLVTIHRELKKGRGKRTREIALNRAIVLLSVAAWQALVQDLARAGLEHLSPSGGQPRQDYNLLKAFVTNAIYDFATPNAENSRTLLLRLGFDPWPHWQWQEGQRQITSALARERLNQWLRVRHAIAHGHAELPDVGVLARVPDGRRTLRLNNCERGMRFFRRLCSATAEALDEELQ